MITWITKKSWNVAGASEIGIAHVNSGLPCQDASRYFSVEDTLIACVADGAGSARHSDQGAAGAVDAFVVIAKDMLQRSEPGDLMEIASAAFEAARDAVLKIAGDDPREYATTLSGVIIKGDELVALQIGDGAVVVDDAVVLDSYTSTHANAGDYANETRFLTEADAKPISYSTAEHVNRVALLTDGLDNIALENNGYLRTPFKPFFDPMFNWIERLDDSDKDAQLGQFLVSERVRAKTNDDVTLLLAFR